MLLPCRSHTDLRLNPARHRRDAYATLRSIVEHPAGTTPSQKYHRLLACVWDEDEDDWGGKLYRRARINSLQHFSNWQQTGAFFPDQT